MDVWGVVFTRTSENDLQNRTSFDRIEHNVAYVANSTCEIPNRCPYPTSHSWHRTTGVRRQPTQAATESTKKKNWHRTTRTNGSGLVYTKMGCKHLWAEAHEATMFALSKQRAFVPMPNWPAADASNARGISWIMVSTTKTRENAGILLRGVGWCDWSRHTPARADDYSTKIGAQISIFALARSLCACAKCGTQAEPQRTKPTHWVGWPPLWERSTNSFCIESTLLASYDRRNLSARPCPSGYRPLQFDHVRGEIHEIRDLSRNNRESLQNSSWCISFSNYGQYDSLFVL